MNDKNSRNYFSTARHSVSPIFAPICMMHSRPAHLETPASEILKNHINSAVSYAKFKFILFQDI